jgi:endonuclease/exonuclease/phosphatase family metal-dependent hydrolase
MMKRSIAFAALLLASTSLGLAQTQPAETQAGAKSGGQAECMAGDTNCKPGAQPKVEGQANTQMQTDTSTTASTDAKANFGTVMSSIEAGKTNVSAITGLTAVNKVNVVKVGDLAKGNNMQALDKAITDNQTDITGLQTAISGNTALKAKLDAEQVQASSVVAADVEADGSVTVFVK